MSGQRPVVARFSVVGSFYMPARSLFGAVGDVIEGEIKPGMTVGVRHGNLLFTGPIASVEVIEVDFRAQAYLGLVFGFEEKFDLEFWSSLRIGGEVLEILTS